jgi:hypothetical protein
MERAQWVLTALLVCTMLAAVTSNKTQIRTDSPSILRHYVAASESDIEPIRYRTIRADYREDSAINSLEVADARTASAFSFTNCSTPEPKSHIREYLRIETLQTETNFHETDTLIESVCLGCAFPGLPVDYNAMGEITEQVSDFR